MQKNNLSWGAVDQRANAVARRIAWEHPGKAMITAYAVPRGGIPAALAIIKHCPRITLVEDTPADIYIDDVIDSGKTRSQYPGPFYALVNKLEGPDFPDEWISFPWERAEKADGPQENIRRLLQYIGEDPERDGLRDTPNRVVRSYAELYAGYKQDPAKMLTVFEKGTYDELVLLKGIEFSSTCEHHMLPFSGSAHIAYIPNTKVVGISKLVRVLEIFTRRLQIQERICEQVTAALMEHLQPQGAACVLAAAHQCMTCRGVQKQHSTMVTSSLKGVFLEKPEARAEFFQLVR